MIDLPETSTATTPEARDSEWQLQRPAHLNSEVDWNTFDPELYLKHNYLTLRDDDHQIIVRMREFFADAKLADARGVDVGAGSNLYPSLAMLPFCRQLDLHEFADTNIAWLRQQIQSFDDHWDAFWDVLARNAAYAALPDPRARLREVAAVSQSNILTMPERTWDLGTMFFVACSISNDMDEFHQANRHFVRSLKPGAPFAAAFMEGSVGYPVGDVIFPAVRIRSADVAESLARVAYDDVFIETITFGDAPLRDGYSGGMILALGRAAG